MRRVLLAGVFVLSAMACAQAQVQQERFSYPVGLDPYGDNFLALRSLPSGTEGVRIARLGPDTLFTEIGRRGGWVNIQLPSGQTGWVSARYVGCCRTAASGRSVPSGSVSSSCEELWSERNAIFKAAGYCFRTSQAIQAFGNAGASLMTRRTCHCRHANGRKLLRSGRRSVSWAAGDDDLLGLRAVPRRS